MRDAVTNRRRPDPRAAARFGDHVAPPLRQAELPLRYRRTARDTSVSFSQAGRTRTLTLREHDLAEVEAALARYRPARDDLEQRAAAGVEALAARLAARREQARR